MRKFLGGIFALISVSGFLILFGGFFGWKFITNIPVIGENPFFSAISITFIFGWLSKLTDTKNEHSPANQ